MVTKRTKEREDQRKRRPRKCDTKRASGDQRITGLENRKTKGTGIGGGPDDQEAREYSGPTK